MKPKVVVKHLFKVFGDNPEEAMNLLNQGIGKAEIFERTGKTIGVMDASFEIFEGEIFVVMGLSGSGKSTLVRLLNRLIEPTSGEVWVGDQNIAALSESELNQLRRSKMSMVFQSFALMPHMNVIDNAAFGLELSGVPRDERHKRARSALAQVGLEANANSYPDELSGGMQQRVGLARALANDPEIMLMDEAFSALDPLIRTEMQDELVKLQKDSKRTVVFISHDLDEAMRIGDRIAIMEGGRVVQVGTPDEILKNPADDYVRSFFRGVDVSTVLSAGDIARRKQVTVIEREGAGVPAALERLRQNERDYGYVVSPDQTFHGVVSINSLLEAEKKGARVSEAFIPGVDPIPAGSSLTDIMGSVASAPCGLPVTDEDGRYLGVISRAVLLQALDREGE
ncbi:glycine betaine/L-proline ABC transporter ATP-binding protein ProV [Marinobacter nanhaiticus D15-8W]|uniref:Quaternary amine transport ATP-binding protein n=1 Tax=Marinobacter nanhaiticus D15-8W TaxID=626887 RepID=N6WVP9_9GAMM|nr:glycine betaine/L-proline ABC transporter ATP-binding protein ProV [Marinobacter nanhaiticus]ENO15107.1 proline/glycine betaine ABC transporter ATP-binding protein ProV [Marinobacter nanhaiticus D15-8W]BES69194.1 glycine betaine/L-proline ABC transporter ATP-binding protein ProV [Marinobacter nanhaiticus D15-8W]